MMNTALLAGLLVAGVAGGGMMANEMTHGGVAETMGLGHHHMADYGGYHCASHDGAHATHHLEHMHGDMRFAHDGCPGGAGMHSGMRGGMASLGGSIHG